VLASEGAIQLYPNAADRRVWVSPGEVRRLYYAIKLAQAPTTNVIGYCEFKLTMVGEFDSLPVAVSFTALPTLPLSSGSSSTGSGGGGSGGVDPVSSSDTVAPIESPTGAQASPYFFRFRADITGFGLVPWELTKMETVEATTVDVVKKQAADVTALSHDIVSGPRSLLVVSSRRGSSRRSLRSSSTPSRVDVESTVRVLTKVAKYGSLEAAVEGAKTLTASVASGDYAAILVEYLARHREPATTTTPTTPTTPTTTAGEEDGAEADGEEERVQDEEELEVKIHGNVLIFMTTKDGMDIYVTEVEGGFSSKLVEEVDEGGGSSSSKVSIAGVTGLVLFCVTLAAGTYIIYRRRREASKTNKANTTIKTGKRSTRGRGPDPYGPQGKRTQATRTRRSTHSHHKGKRAPDFQGSDRQMRTIQEGILDTPDARNDVVAGERPFVPPATADVPEPWVIRDNRLHHYYYFHQDGPKGGYQDYQDYQYTKNLSSPTSYVPGVTTPTPTISPTTSLDSEEMEKTEGSVALGQTYIGSLIPTRAPPAPPAGHGASPVYDDGHEDDDVSIGHILVPDLSGTRTSTQRQQGPRRSPSFHMSQPVFRHQPHDDDQPDGDAGIVNFADEGADPWIPHHSDPEGLSSSSEEEE